MRFHFSSLFPYRYLPSGKIRALGDREVGLPLMVSHVLYSKEE